MADVSLPYRSERVWVDHPPEVVAFCEELQALGHKHNVFLDATVIRPGVSGAEWLQ